MALVEQARVDFDTDAKVGTFCYSPAPGGLANIADLRRSVVDGVSCIDQTFGTTIPTKEYFTTAASDAYAKMVADIANVANGAILACYSADSTKHGFYTKTAGALSARTGPITTPLAADENHRRVAQLGLVLQSFSQAGDPLAAADGPGGIIDKTGYPHLNGGNLDGYVLRWTMRAIGMSMARDVKLVQHFQTRIPSAPLIGSANAPLFVNAVNKAQCLSDSLGFGQNGLFAPNAVEYVADSGWVDIDIPLVALPSYWLALGGNDGPPGSDAEKMGRAPYTKGLRYGVADPRVWLRNWTGNAYVCQAKFNPDPSSDLPVVPLADSIQGRLLTRSFAFLKEVP